MFRKANNADSWSAWNTVLHTGNFPGVSTSSVANTLVQRTASGYVFAEIYNDNWAISDTENVGGFVIKNGSDGYHRSVTPYRAKAVMGLNDETTHSNAVGLATGLKWVNYGNSHRIVDASNNSFPVSGSNTYAQNRWSSSYPHLVGFNGSQSYGVRVDNAFQADGVKTYSGADPSGLQWGNMWLRTDL